MPITVRQKTVKTTPRTDLRSKKVIVNPAVDNFRSKICLESAVDQIITKSAACLSPLIETARKPTGSAKLRRNSLTRKPAIIVTPRASKPAKRIQKTSHLSVKTRDLCTSVLQNDTDDDNDDISDEQDGMSCQH